MNRLIKISMLIIGLVLLIFSAIGIYNAFGFPLDSREWLLVVTGIAGIAFIFLGIKRINKSEVTS